MQIQQTLQTMQNSQHYRQTKLNLFQDITHKMEAVPVRINVQLVFNIYWVKYCIRLMKHSLCDCSTWQVEPSPAVCPYDISSVLLIVRVHKRHTFHAIRGKNQQKHIQRKRVKRDMHLSITLATQGGVQLTSFKGNLYEHELLDKPMNFTATNYSICKYKHSTF